MVDIAAMRLRTVFSAYQIFQGKLWWKLLLLKYVKSFIFMTDQIGGNDIQTENFFLHIVLHQKC